MIRRSAARISASRGPLGDERGRYDPGPSLARISLLTPSLLQPRLRCIFPSCMSRTCWACRPVRASLLFPAVNLAVIAGSLARPTAPWSTRRSAQPRWRGFTGIAIGITILEALPSGGLPVAQLLSAFVLIGAGLGIASVASTQTGTDAAEPAFRGVASGLLNSAAQVGTAVGVALLVPLCDGDRLGGHDGLSHRIPGSLHHRPGRCPQQFSDTRPGAALKSCHSHSQLITCPRSGVVSDASEKDLIEGE